MVGHSAGQKVIIPPMGPVPHWNKWDSPPGSTPNTLITGGNHAAETIALPAFRPGVDHFVGGPAGDGQVGEDSGLPTEGEVPVKGM